ncbi:hypothetical protein AS594_24590 [Streptomyces agglomeratus]|uniref:Integral membrane protein n=1 Tax=Streptomyces agglomeratus TaxID=285458 RepID=A0A1E5PJF6_9ACTN|nr:hypothetical protein [Streptomyces agglomeratus]OEJ29681.1 hypothetical protein AS594_24590 [Streptomyces agglomeratus]
MTDIRSPLRALRAALFAAVCVIPAAVGHSYMSGHEVPVSGLLAAFAVTGGLAWTAGHRWHGAATVGGGLLAVQGILHLVFGTAREPGAGHHRMPVTSHQPAMDPEAMAAAAAHGQGSSSLAMTAAHLAAALVCGLWLARGEAAFFRLARAVGALAAAPLRLLLVVVRAPELPQPARPAGPRTTRRHGHGVVLAHTLSRRGPPRVPITRATAPALPTV